MAPIKDIANIKPDELKKVFEALIPKLADYITLPLNHDNKVVNYVPPEELKKIAKLELDIQAEGLGLDTDLKSLEKVLHDCMTYSVRTMHPRFNNQLWSGQDIISIMAEFITIVTNSSPYTYEVCPLYSLMELEVVKTCCDLVGFKEGDGIMVPGGAIGNLVAIITARNTKLTYCKKHGMKEKDLNMVIFASQDSHYTMQRGANILGLGTDAVIKVPCDVRGKMRPDKLEEAIVEQKKKGKIPVMVDLTCGTTVYGAFDDVDAISDICKKHDIWCHIDASWGGGCYLSEKQRYKLKGSEKVNSITWAFHKMTNLTQQCAILLVNGKETLKRSNSSDADYLFHDHDVKPYDLGDKSINCGRRNDSLKIWLAMKVHGIPGLGKRVDAAFENVEYFVQEIQKRPKFKLLNDKPECLNVCFWYIPDQLKQFKGEEYDKKLALLTQEIRAVMQLEGKMLINYQPLYNPYRPDFFRIILVNPRTTHDDIDFILNEFEVLGEKVGKKLFEN